jgi:hypothetical protein
MPRSTATSGRRPGQILSVRPLSAKSPAHPRPQGAEMAELNLPDFTLYTEFDAAVNFKAITFFGVN